LSGCPDGDKDGIADKDDKCPETAGKAEYRGCPPSDRDQDGVGDVEDQCPDIAGEIKWKGCPDSDGDNTPDDKDACPDAPGPENLSGCPDSDKDGIADKDDKCPNTAGTAALKGCPNLPPPDKAVYFRPTQSDWYRTSDETLDEILEMLQKDPSLQVHIEGHTDETSEKAAPTDLSERRAKKILDFLTSKGIEPRRLSIAGFGSDRPAKADIRSQDPLLNQQLNRRVEVRFSRE
jgi:outer membrane protein OmpA-like peptidoglycan-associated protein